MQQTKDQEDQVKESSKSKKSQQEAMIDETLEDTFPASDSPAWYGGKDIPKPTQSNRKKFMKFILLIAGILALVMGLLWIGQGLGQINWPSNSFMIRQTQWSYYGAGLAVGGIILIWLSRK